MFNSNNSVIKLNISLLYQHYEQIINTVLLTIILSMQVEFGFVEKS